MVLEVSNNHIKKAGMMAENLQVQELFSQSCAQGPLAFPQHRRPLAAPTEPGVGRMEVSGEWAISCRG